MKYLIKTLFLAVPWIKLIGSIVIFLIALMWVKKRINIEGQALKIVSFLIPIVGIIMCILKLKENREVAMKYLKVSIVGIVTYVAIVLLFAIMTYVAFILPVAGL